MQGDKKYANAALHMLTLVVTDLDVHLGDLHTYIAGKLYFQLQPKRF
jgi:hypothetical protein